MTDRKKIDWVACEGEYRTGTFSNRQLAERFGCTEAAIRDHAKRHGWQKDLSEQVRSATNARLLRTELRTPDAREDAQIVEDGAEVRVCVVLRHRKDIAHIEALKRTLVEKAAVLIDGISDMEGLSDAAGTIESLARTSARLIPLERQAYNLDDGNRAAPSPAEIRSAIEEARAELARRRGSGSGNGSAAT